MNTTRVFIARLAGCGVFDPVGDRVGKVIDVLVAYRNSGAPKTTGMLVEITGRRRVFVPISRVTSIAPGQVITNGLIDLRRFSQRGQEVRVIAEILGRKVNLKDGSGSASIEDLAIEEHFPQAVAQLGIGIFHQAPGEIGIGGPKNLEVGIHA